MSKTILPDARRSPRFAGIPTFCRYPRIEDVSAANRPVDWAIYGVPFDAGVTYRPGARFGPRAVRVESQYVKRYSIEHGVDVCELLSLADAGDSPVSPFDLDHQSMVQLEWLHGVGDPRRTRLMAVGGDHSIAHANIRATWERFSKPKSGLALIHFDSHLDTVDTVWGHPSSHASVFRRAIEDGLIDPRWMLSIGVKGPLNTPEDLDFAKKHGVTLVTYDRFRREGMKPIGAFVASLKDRPVYITFDIDCVDPAYAPGTGTPSVGGLTSAEALTLLRSLAGINLVGADVVEVLPDRDVSGITALLAAHIMFEILCLDAVRRNGRSKANAGSRKKP